MASYEEDAFSRVQQMHSRVPAQSTAQRRNNASRPPEREKEIQAPPPAPEPKNEAPVQTKTDSNILGALFQNNEQSLILLLIVLLMEENADPVLLLALLYLLL